MDDTREQAQVDVDLSPAQRLLFYIGEGLIAGGFVYMVVTATLLIAVFFEEFPFGEFVVFLFFVFFLMAFQAVILWGGLSSLRSGDRPAVYQEWSDIRRWHWVGLLGLLIGGGLTALTVLRQGWDWNYALPDMIILGTLFGGVAFHIFARYLAERNLR